MRKSARAWVDQCAKVLLADALFGRSDKPLLPDVGEDAALVVSLNLQHVSIFLVHLPSA
jgi:hypothetical protein